MTLTERARFYQGYRSGPGTGLIIRGYARWLRDPKSILTMGRKLYGARLQVEEITDDQLRAIERAFEEGV